MDIDVLPSVDVNNCHRNADTLDHSLNKPVYDLQEFHNIQDGIADSKPPHDKRETVPCSSKTVSSAETSVEGAPLANDIIVQESTPRVNIKSADQSCSHSSSLPPVSAMKGSREKRGVTPPQKLTVKWDPDVYDPVPTSVSHSPNNKPPRKSKKNSKSKQKNGSKSNRGNKYKDKLAGKRGGG